MSLPIMSFRLKPLQASLLFFCLMLISACAKPQAPSSQVLHCEDMVKGCQFATFFVQFNQIPSPLKPFKVSVKSPMATLIHADFVMQGMAMGLNRYQLLEGHSKYFEAEVILPVCVQGRADWMMQLELVQAGKTLRFELPFTSGAS